MPWATWYEATTGTGFGNHNNVFASRFDNTGDVNQGKWIFGGQSRGTGGGNVPVPSLNIHTNQDAENPSVAGGSAVDPTKPGPWVTWQETTTAPVSGKDQIFVERPIGPGSANCDGVTPAGVADGRARSRDRRLLLAADRHPARRPRQRDPSLNVDPTRNGIEPDIAFTGANDSVPWVVWYETDATSIAALQNNEMVFAAKGVSDGVGVNGGFHWVAVGNAAQGTLDTTRTHHFGPCAASAANEQQCSLNPDPGRGRRGPARRCRHDDRREPDGALGRLGRRRLRGQADLRLPARRYRRNRALPDRQRRPADLDRRGDATRPDITFSGNTPYVTWRQNRGGVDTGFVGHFVEPDQPAFVLDESNVPLTPTAQADVREPISSACTANPFNADGSACQGPAVGTPFFLHTDGTAPGGLLAKRYQSANRHHGRGERRHVVVGERHRIGQPARRLGQCLVPVRDDHRLRAVRRRPTRRPRTIRSMASRQC